VGEAGGVVAQAKPERSIRIVELDPTLGWYSADPEALPTALVIWARS
jgi:hypothetical protein